MSKIIRPGDPLPTSKQEEQIIYWLSRGAIPDTAIARAGVPKTLFHRWLRSGAAGEEPCATFAARIDSALVLFECKLIEMIAENANKNINAAQWLLMLRFGPKYRKFADQEAGIESNLPMATQPIAEVSEEELEAAEKRALEASKFVEKSKPKAFGLEQPKTKH